MRAPLKLNLTSQLGAKFLLDQIDHKLGFIMIKIKEKNVNLLAMTVMNKLFPCKSLFFFVTGAGFYLDPDHDFPSHKTDIDLFHFQEKR